MHRLYVIVLFAITTALSAHGQVKKNYFEIELGSLTGIGNLDYGNQIRLPNEGTATRLRASFGRFINEKTSIAVGAGFDAYHEPDHNTFPIFIDASRFIHGGLYSFLNVGYAVKLGPEFDTGRLIAFGLGYRNIKKKRAFNYSLGFNSQALDGKLILVDPSLGRFQRVAAKIISNSISINVAYQF